MPELSLRYGMTSPGAYYALMMRRHQHEYGTTPEQLSTVALTLREHASRNPNAVMREPITAADYHAAPLIAEPLRRFDYCLINDGGVAMIVTAADRAADRPAPPVYVTGFAQQAQFLRSELPPEDFWHAGIAAAGRRAYEMAGISREAVDALMVYDNFSPNVLFALEGLGFAPVGESGAWIQDGRIGLEASSRSTPQGATSRRATCRGGR